jgi:tyrosyl-tRNA synthetase
LSRAHGCRLQVGGSDQYGNITAGCELSRKMGGPQLFGLTAPLLLDSSGQKMGKTSTGERVWLDAERTSPYAFYQYFFNVTDEEAPRLLRLFSLRSLTELEELVRVHGADPSQRHAQRELARHMTTWVHGAEETARVEEASRIMFGGSLEGVHERTLEVLAKVVPVVDIDRSELANGIAIVDLLSRTVADSKSAARRLLQQGGAYINNIRITDGERKVSTADLATPTMLVVRGGRKDYRLVRAVSGARPI